MMYKNLLSLIAILITLVAFFPYIHAIYKGTTKPHVFSWVIWGLTTTIVFFAQVQAQAGIGALPIGISGLITVGVACLAWFKRNDLSIAFWDWVFLVLALVSLPLWYFTSDPLWAVVVLTIVDVLGFGPTLRKAYHHPFEENMLFFMLFAVRNGLAIAALESYSWTTVLFPASIGLACMGLIFLLLYRRGQKIK